MTREEFIHNAQRIHVNNNQQTLYDYSQVKYVNSKTKITLKCNAPGHGDFSLVPAFHLKGHGCTKCTTKKI